MKKIYIISIIIISIFIISVVITLNFTKSENENNKQEEIKNTQISEIIEDECTEEYIQEKELTPVVSEPEKISINAQLILKKYFRRSKRSCKRIYHF